MSNEMYVFLRKNEVPSQSEWQEALESLNLPLELCPDLKPLDDSGFCPCKIKGIDSGFEIYSETAQDTLSYYPEVVGSVADRDWRIAFRWGGDRSELACVLAASAGLLTHCGAVVYFPDSPTCGLDELVQEMWACLAEV